MDKSIQKGVYSFETDAVDIEPTPLIRFSRFLTNQDTVFLQAPGSLAAALERPQFDSWRGIYDGKGPPDR